MSLNEIPVKKIRAINIPEIKDKIVSGEYHIHTDKSVPDFCLNMWKERGYNAHKKGVIHVRYPPKTFKYVFPLYFWVNQDKDCIISKIELMEEELKNNGKMAVKCTKSAAIIAKILASESNQD